RPLIEALQRQLGGTGTVSEAPQTVGRPGVHAGVPYHNIRVSCPSAGTAPFGADTKTQPPHDIPDRPIADHLPRGPGSDLLRDLMQRSQAILAAHPINQARSAQGKRAATQIWLWGQGCAPSLRPFRDLYGPRGAIISAVDLVRGV